MPVHTFDVPYDAGEAGCLHLLSVISPIADRLAVVELRHGVCQGCHLELTPGELAEGREIGRLGMVRCVQCGRLLVESTGE